MSSSQGNPATAENSHGGLNVADFDRPAIVPSVKQSLSLLPGSKRRLVYLAALLQVSLGFLDLIGIILIGLVAAIAVSGIGVTGIPEWGQRILDFIGIGGLTVSQQSVILAGAAVFVLIAKTVASAFLTRRITRFLANRQADVSTRLARQFLSRPLTEVQGWTTSEAIYALGAGVGAATVSLLGAAIMIAAESFLFAIIGITLLIYDPVLTVAVGAFFGLIVLTVHRILSRIAQRNASIVRGTSIDTLTAVSEALATYRETTVLNRRDLYVTRYEGIVGRFATASASNAFVMEIPKYVLEVALYAGILVIGVIQFLTKDWGAAAATVALFLAAGTRITPALLRLQGAGITIKNASVAAQPTFYMAESLTKADAEKGVKARGQRITGERIHSHVMGGYPDFGGGIEVKDVWLTYPDASEPALAGISFSVNPGTSVAFVGSTGAGKSSLADVLLGVHEPQLGRALIGGVSPRDAIDRWPGAISYVPQVVALVEGSVRENVALGLPRPDIDDDLVWEALERAHLAEFLRSNRQGLDTAIGERGFRLSGGQRQRLGIARALYTRPRLLVLDEATSSLDSETERAIAMTLEELEGDVTTVTVAHRLATVRNADQLLYLKHGRMVARGTFEAVRREVPDFDRQASLLGL
jgi:ABC-type multidrug transport system fused ATPase/permease subunit